MHISQKYICSEWKYEKAFLMLSMILILLAFPVSALSQTLAWDPAWLDFGPVPIGDTGHAVLTLTNTDAVDPLDVISVELTYNQQGFFGFEASEALPAVLAPGQSMEVIFSFSPDSSCISFAMADAMITNDSTNAPVLYYTGILASCTPGDPCFPLDNCGGLCIDTQTDVDNCGSCFNECPTVENGTVACITGSCSYTCDEGYEWDGDSCELIVSQTPLEMLQDLIVFVESAKDDGTIIGFGPGNSGEDRYDQFMDWLMEAEELLASGEIDQACGQLRTAQLRTDGGYPFQFPMDHIAGEASYEINEEILEIMDAIAEMYPWANCEPREPINRRGQFPQ